MGYTTCPFKKNPYLWGTLLLEELKNLSYEWLFNQEYEYDRYRCTLFSFSQGLEVYQVASDGTFVELYFRGAWPIYYALKVYRDNRNVYEYMMESEERGLERGMEKGLKKGMEEGKIETARNFKRLGVSTDIIRQATGLSEEEIQQL